MVNRRRQRSAFIDLAPSSKQSTGAQLSQPDAVLTGVVTGIVDQATGIVEVALDGSDDLPVVVSADAGFTYVGARVLAPRDSTGRIVGVKVPVGSAPEGVDIIPVGEEATQVVAHGERITQLDTDLTQAREDLDAAREHLTGRLDATDAAVSAASAIAASADGRLTVSDRAPVSGDSAGKPDGAIWQVRSGETLIGLYVLIGGSWSQLYNGAETIAAGSIGAREITASENLWAKLAEFGSVTTSMLTAGNATIAGTAVVGDIVGNTFRGGVLSLLDQVPTPSTTVATWMTANPFSTSGSFYLFGDPRYSASRNADGLTLTVESGTTRDGMLPSLYISTIPNVGPKAAVGEITVTATLTPSYSASGNAVGSSTPRGVGLAIRSNANTWYQAFSEPTTPGEPVTLTVLIPEGEWIHQSAPNIHVRMGAGATTGDTLKVSNFTVSWPPTLTTGLKIYRDSTGQARIDIIGQDNYVTTLNSDGVTVYNNEGTVHGSTSWKNFVTPPIGVYKQDSNQSLTHGSWNVGVIGSGIAFLSGGMRYSNNAVIVPVSGWYSITGRGRFANYQAGRRIVGILVNGSLTPVVENGTPAIAGTTSVEVNTIIQLSAGDRVSVGVFQDSGTTLNSVTRALTVKFETQ